MRFRYAFIFGPLALAALVACEEQVLKPAECTRLTDKKTFSLEYVEGWDYYKGRVDGFDAEITKDDSGDWSCRVLTDEQPATIQETREEVLM